MGKQKITMRDIAKECGISVATVSYVLNHSEKEKISHETRLKVLETATRLHYEAHSPHTRTKTKNGLCGVIINFKESNAASKKAIYYDLASELSQQLLYRGYETIFIATRSPLRDFAGIRNHNPDAVFMIDIDNRIVRKVTEEYYVPIIFLDCIVNDPLFCEIRPDYDALFPRAASLLGEAHPFLLAEDCFCQNQIALFSHYFLTQDLFLNSPNADLQAFLKQHAGRKGIVIGDWLGMQAQQLFPAQNLAILSFLGEPNLFRADSNLLQISNQTKASAAVEVLQDMLSLDYQAGSANHILLPAQTPDPPCI